MRPAAPPAPALEEGDEILAEKVESVQHLKRINLEQLVLYRTISCLNGSLHGEMVPQIDGVLPLLRAWHCSNSRTPLVLSRTIFKKVLHRTIYNSKNHFNQ